MQIAYTCDTCNHELALSFGERNECGNCGAIYEPKVKKISGGRVKQPDKEPPDCPECGRETNWYFRGGWLCPAQGAGCSGGVPEDQKLEGGTI